MSDNVMFHTADPVTGTTMLMGDNGTYTYKEESEPLGQRIEAVDPSPGYPDEYTEITDIASQPNWNCSIMEKVAGGFFNMPVECQKKELELMSFSIESALQSMEPENPSRISVDHELGHVAGPDQLERAATSAVAFTLQSTMKTDGGDEQGAVIESNIPDQCSWDRDGNPDCSVTVSSGDIPGFVDASSGGVLGELSPEKKGAMTNALEEVAGRIEKNLLSSKCRMDVIEKLKTLEGFDEKKFLEFLKKGGDFYNGETTTARMEEYDPFRKWGDKTIAKRFEETDGLHAFTATGAQFQTLTVFFDPDFIETKSKTSSVSGIKQSGLTNDNLVFIFHEALHGFGNSIGKVKGNYDDEALTILFYGESKTGGSVVISDYIYKKCFSGN